MEGSLSDSGSDVHVPDGGLRCASPEPVHVGSDDEAPADLGVKQELVEQPDSPCSAALEPDGKRLRVS